MCQSSSEPCNGGCTGGLTLCDGGQVCVSEDDPDYYTCNGACVHVSAPCEDTCTNSTWLCGNECVSESNRTVVACGDTCQSAHEPCEGHCATSGLSMCNNTCLPDVAEFWSCDGTCVSAYTPCHGSCPPGRVASDGECLDPYDLCHDEPECSVDSDCQEGAACLFQLNRFYCQCRLGLSLVTSSDSSCPITGTCSSEANQCQDCYSWSDSITVCPRCNATTSQTTYQYVSSETGQ